MMYVGRCWDTMYVHAMDVCLVGEDDGDGGSDAT
jgi:hypothetical protein